MLRRLNSHFMPLLMGLTTFALMIAYETVSPISQDDAKHPSAPQSNAPANDNNPDDESDEKPKPTIANCLPDGFLPRRAELSEESSDESIHTPTHFRDGKKFPSTTFAATLTVESPWPLTLNPAGSPFVDIDSLPNFWSDPAIGTSVTPLAPPLA